MPTIDYLNQGERKKVLDEILNNQENINRKKNSLITLECFKGRQAPYILSKIREELGEDAAQNSRTITSINLTRKIVKKKSRLYSHEPDREFSGLSEKQTAHVQMLYEKAKADVKYKKSQEIFKLQDQGMMQAVFKDGMIQFRPLHGHHYDVVPKLDDPEVPDAVIVSSFDKTRLFNDDGVDKKDVFDLSGRSNTYFSDAQNQKTADPDDWRGNMTFFWWTDEYNFATDGNGHIVDSQTGQKMATVTDKDVENPFKILPFVDIASDKDFEYFVRSGYGSTAFNLDLGVLLSDTAEINRMQGWAQAVIASVEQPKNTKVGPRNMLWLKLDPKAAESAKPTFSFQSPNADLASSLQLISNYLSLYLTSEDMDPKEVNAMGEKNESAGALDRWLKMIENFDSNQDDMALFTGVEKRMYEIIIKINNVFANVTESGFIPELAGVMIPDDSKLEIKFHKPEMLMSEDERLNLIERRVEMGLISNVESIEIDRNVEKDQALEIKKQILQDEMDLLELMPPPPVTPPPPTETQDDPENPDEEIEEETDEDLDAETEQSSQ